MNSLIVFLSVILSLVGSCVPAARADEDRWAESLVVNLAVDGRSWRTGRQQRDNTISQLQLVPEGQDLRDPNEFVMTTYIPGHREGFSNAQQIVLNLADARKKWSPVRDIRFIRATEQDAIAEWIEVRNPDQYSLARAVIGPKGRNVLSYTGRVAVKQLAERERWVKILSAATLLGRPLLPEAGSAKLEPKPTVTGSPQQEAGGLLEKYKADAARGIAPAQFNLGIMHEQGDGVAKNEAEAAKWYEKAAEHGYAQAQFNLAIMYAEGRGVSKNDVEAARWCLKAAEQRVARAESFLGDLYEQGRGVPKDTASAINWYRRAAENGIAAAQYNLGIMLSNGQGVKKDPIEAQKWFQQAKANGFDPDRETTGK